MHAVPRLTPDRSPVTMEALPVGLSPTVYRRATRVGRLVALFGPACVIVASACVGCGSGDVVKEVRIPVRQQVTAIQRCREYLEGYARGEPVGSEVIGFGQLIEDAERENAELGATIGRGLRDIESSMKRPQDVAAKARAILEALPAAE